MEIIWLEKPERERFIKYLEQENHSDKMMIEQMEKISNLGMGDVFAKHKKVIMAARQMIINDLSRVEEAEL